LSALNQNTKAIELKTPPKRRIAIIVVMDCGITNLEKINVVGMINIVAKI